MSSSADGGSEPGRVLPGRFPRRLQGIALAGGVAQGPAVVMGSGDAPCWAPATMDVPLELDRLRAALEEAAAEVVALRQHLRPGETSDALANELLALRDCRLLEVASRLIARRRVSAEDAVRESVDRVVRRYTRVGDAYFLDRAKDLADIRGRVTTALLRARPADRGAVTRGAIVVAAELPATTAVRLATLGVSAFVLERGGPTSHAAILARALGLAAVGGVAGITGSLTNGDSVLVDGEQGEVIVHPLNGHSRRPPVRGHPAGARSLPAQSCETADGSRVELHASVGVPLDVEAALAAGAAGVGIVRTEWAFAASLHTPTEVEQYEHACALAERFAPRPVVFRLFDLGPDAPLPFLELPSARNPRLAPRGLRLLLAHPALLSTQLRALLRAATKRSIALLLPAVVGADDVAAFRSVLEGVKRSLLADGHPTPANVRIGAMIDLPAAALALPWLARAVDFFTVGLDDLVPYLLGTDRDDPVSASDELLRPAVPRILDLMRDAAFRAHRPLYVSGELAANPRHTALLLGLGLRRFSVPPARLGELREKVQTCRIGEAEALAQRVLALRSPLVLQEQATT